MANGASTPYAMPHPTPTAFGKRYLKKERRHTQVVGMSCWWWVSFVAFKRDEPICYDASNNTPLLRP